MEQRQRFPDAEYHFVYTAVVVSVACFGPSQLTLYQTIATHSLKVNKDQKALVCKRGEQQLKREPVCAREKVLGAFPFLV